MPEEHDLLDNQTAARELRLAPQTLHKSRVTGLLGGRRAPAYLKLGRRVYYERAVIVAWREGCRRLSTSQAAAE